MALDEDVTTAAEVFAQVQQRFRSEKAGDLNGSCEFRLTGDGGGMWTAEVRRGAFTVTPFPKPDADVHVSLPAELFVRLATGRADGFSAFLGGKLKVEGDKDLAYRLSGLFF